jgi:integrase
MKRRGLGMVYQRGLTWWIQYHWRGQRYRETSSSTVRMDAIKLLRKRMAEMGKGQLRGPDLEKTTFADLVQMIRDDYVVNQRRSTRRLNTSLKALESAFGPARAFELSLDRLNRYVSDRMAAGVAPATVKLELTHLHKAFRLAERAGMAVCPPFPHIAVRNVRTGFFERPDVEAVRSHLPEAFRGLITFACLTGWRVPSEILTLRWNQVDFSAGIVRLEPGSTKNDEGRVFPFGVLPELSNLLRAQWEQARFLELSTGQSIPWVFHWNDRGSLKEIHPKVLYRRWKEACRKAGVPTRIPHDFRRTAVRNLERAGVPRSVAMKLTGHKTEAVYRRYAIVCEADLTEGLKKLAVLEESLGGKIRVKPQLSHSFERNPSIYTENMAEGARFELADPLRGLQFSRLARSATPSPLHTLLEPTRSERMPLGTGSYQYLIFLNPFHPTHVRTQHLRYHNVSIRLLIVFEDGHERTADSQPGPIESMNKLCFCTLRPDRALISNISSPGLKCFKVAAGGDFPIVVLGRKPNLDIICLCCRKSHIAGAEGDNSVMQS